MQSIIKPDWQAPASIHAYTTTRLGGVSEGPFACFNLANDRGDDENNVQKNRAILKKTVQLPTEPLWLKQTHGTTVADISLMDDFDPQHYLNTPSKMLNNPLLADGAYSRCSNKICVVTTADCLPVLLCNKAGTEVAAIHAGWKGLLAGILENAVACFSSSPQELLAWLGPAIGPNRFEVRADVRDPFIAHNSEHAQAFTRSGPEHWLANIYLLAKHRLQSQGVTHITGGDFCTFSDTERFFSARRDGIDSGRMASFIWISPL